MFLRSLAKCFYVSFFVLALTACGSSDSKSPDVPDVPDVPDMDGDTIADSADNCPEVANTNQLDTDDDGAGDACDTTPNGDTDLDTIDNLADNCPVTANTDQSDTDSDNVGDACDADIDGDTLANAVDPDPLNSESKYHFDFFYNQLSSVTEAFKAAVVGETVTQADGTIDIGVGVDSTTLDLGSDETGNGSFDVRADYATTEESLSYTGTDFSSATPTLTVVTVSSVKDNTPLDNDTVFAKLSAETVSYVKVGAAEEKSLPV